MHVTQSHAPESHFLNSKKSFIKCHVPFSLLLGKNCYWLHMPGTREKEERGSVVGDGLLGEANSQGNGQGWSVANNGGIKGGSQGIPQF